MPTDGLARRSRELGPPVPSVIMVKAEKINSTKSKPKKDPNHSEHLEVEELSLNRAEDSIVPSAIASIFCPRAFRKGRLAEGYARFQSFDTLQALCSYLRGVLCTQALLKGLGVGSSEASAGAAALTFITRDGVGMLGSLGLAWGCSESFGRRIKAWRLFADVCNDIALALDLYAPRFAPSNTFVVLVCISSILKAWCGVCAGATRAAITSHFALHTEDIADIAAKEGSQETAVTLIGMILGYLFLKYEADPSDVQTNLIWGLFWVLTLVHVWANYEAVRSLHFRTLDWVRLDIVIRHKKRTIQEVSSFEPLLPIKPSVPYPSFDYPEEGGKNTIHRFVAPAEFNQVAFFGSCIAVADGASAKEVVCAAIAMRWVQLNSSLKTPLSELSIMAAEVMPSYMSVVDILEKHGWDLENSRALLGDVHEKRVRFVSE